jgi:hypothetical protein
MAEHRDEQGAKEAALQFRRSQALWAADCAERVLPLFEEQYPDDDRPRRAIEAARAWARGEVLQGEAATTPVGAHAVVCRTAWTFSAIPRPEVDGRSLSMRRGPDNTQHASCTLIATAVAPTSARRGPTQLSAGKGLRTHPFLRATPHLTAT